MRGDRTDLFVAERLPPIPAIQVDRKVYIKAVPSASSLRYVFNVVMSGGRGSIGWDNAGDSLVLYLRLEEEDTRRFPDLTAGSEVWAAFTVRENG